MELFQRAQNPWGQEVLVRISWTLFWVAIVAGALFCIAHLMMRRRLNATTGSSDSSGVTAAAIPERVERHSFASRAFHWVMAVSMLVLLATGFLPQVGVKFPWVTPHWIAGLVLIASILFHMVHATFFQSLRNMWVSPRDVGEFVQEMRHAFGGAPPPTRKPGKYPLDHKMFHHAIVVAGFAVMVTGIFMMYRIETPIFARDPYKFADGTWGWIYVLHGLSAVGLVFLTISHIYFAVLPEKRWITMSMIYGWISREKFLANHDPERWEPQAAEPPAGEAPEAAPAEAR